MKKLSTLEEEIKLLKFHLQSLFTENTTLKQELEDQKQITIANKKLINDYFGKIFASDEMVTKMGATIREMNEEINKQKKESNELRQRIMLCSQEQLKIICKKCNAELVEEQLQIANTYFLSKQDKMVKELEKTKEELAKLIKDSDINSQSSEDKKENVEHVMLIEMPNREELQETFDKSLENSSPMVFQDTKGNIWQITLHNELQNEISKVIDEASQNQAELDKESSNQKDEQPQPIIDSIKDEDKEKSPIGVSKEVGI